MGGGNYRLNAINCYKMHRYCKIDEKYRIVREKRGIVNKKYRIVQEKRGIVNEKYGNRVVRSDIFYH